jgi:hypothetical protein
VLIGQPAFDLGKEVANDDLGDRRQGGARQGAIALPEQDLHADLKLARLGQAPRGVQDILEIVGMGDQLLELSLEIRGPAWRLE